MLYGACDVSISVTVAPRDSDVGAIYRRSWTTLVSAERSDRDIITVLNQQEHLGGIEC